MTVVFFGVSRSGFDEDLNDDGGHGGAGAENLFVLGLVNKAEFYLPRMSLEAGKVAGGDFMESRLLNIMYDKRKTQTSPRAETRDRTSFFHGDPHHQITGAT